MKTALHLKRLAGPALTLLVELLLMTLGHYGKTVPNGDNLLFIAVTFSGFYGGIASGLIATATVYAAHLLTDLFPGTVPAFLDELSGVSIFISLPILAVMAGFLRHRLDRVRVKEGEYQTIVDNVDAVFFLADAQANRYFYVSSAYEKVWGRHVTDLYKDPTDWLKAVDPEDLAWLRKDLGESFAGVFMEIPGQKPFRVRRPDGTVSWVSSLIVSIKGPSGKVERVAGILQDRTKEVEALKGLESQAERFRKLIENSWDAIVITKLDGTQTYVSPTAEHIFGYPAGEFIHTNVFSNVHPDDLPAAKSAAEELTKYPEKPVTVQLRARHKDGTWRWVEAVMANKTSVVGIDGVIMNLRDITARKEAERAMAEKEERLRQVVDNINEVFFVQAADFSKTYYISPAYEKVWGRDVAEVYADARSFAEAIVPEDREAVFAGVQKTIASGSKAVETVSTFRITRPDGGQRWIESKISFLEPVAGLDARIVGVARDITEQKLAEEEVKHLSELKNNFITTVSHQLRTPLSVVRWNLETIIGEDLGKLKKEQKEFLRITHVANGEVISRINDFLLALDIEENRAHVTKETVSLESLWRTVMNNAVKRCELKGLACPYEAPKKELPAIKADAEKIRIVIEKLVDNATIYTPKGSVAVKLSASDSRVRFEVADTGIGIPKIEQPLVYHRFFRASNASAIKTDASGLGLYIAKHFVEAHGGTIGFTSEEDKGSTFWFELPVK